LKLDHYIKCIYVLSKHVLSEDILHREVIDSKLHSVRLFTKTNKLPKWGERFMNSNDVKIVEESIVDPKKKTFVTYTRNIGYTSVMVNIIFIFIFSCLFILLIYFNINYIITLLIL
jgi:hypothetical protein